MPAELPALVPDASENPLLPVAPAALELMERAHIDVQIATAKRYPRPKIDKIRQNILDYAIVDEETAESCIYTLKRWDAEAKEYKLIQGPSIRLAEILAVCWQNMRAGSRTIDNDGRKITAQGICFDLEKNVVMSQEASRRIVHKDGRPYSEDMQIVTAQAANSVALRNAIFKVVPFATIKPVYEQIKEVALGNASTIQVKRDKIFKRFYAMGVDKERILGVLKKESMETVDLEDLSLLVGLGTAIKDKELTVEEAFQPLPTEEPSGAPVNLKRQLHDRLAQRKAEKAAAREEKPPESEA